MPWPRSPDYYTNVTPFHETNHVQMIKQLVGGWDATALIQAKGRQDIARIEWGQWIKGIRNK